MTKYEDLSLIEKTKLVREMELYFKSKGRQNPNMDDVVKLVEFGYTPKSSDLEMYFNHLINIDDLKPKESTPKPPPIEGNFNLTEATQRFAEQERIDEYKRRQAIDSYNAKTEVPEQPTYYQY